MPEEKWTGELFGLQSENELKLSFRFRLGSGTLITITLAMDDLTIENDAMKVLLQRVLNQKGALDGLK